MESFRTSIELAPVGRRALKYIELSARNLREKPKDLRHRDGCLSQMVMGDTLVHDGGDLDGQRREQEVHNVQVSTIPLGDHVQRRVQPETMIHEIEVRHERCYRWYVEPVHWGIPVPHHADAGHDLLDDGVGQVVDLAHVDQIGGLGHHASTGSIFILVVSKRVPHFCSLFD